MKLAAPVRKSVGKAQDMYPLVLNSLMGAEPMGGQVELLVVAAEIVTVARNVSQSPAQSFTE